MKRFCTDTEVNGLRNAYFNAGCYEKNKMATIRKTKGVDIHVSSFCPLHDIVQICSAFGLDNGLSKL